MRMDSAVMGWTGLKFSLLTWAELERAALVGKGSREQWRDSLTICTLCPLAEVSTFSYASLVTEIGGSTGHDQPAKFTYLSFHHVICEKPFGYAHNTLFIHLRKLKLLVYSVVSHKSRFSYTRSSCHLSLLHFYQSGSIRLHLSSSKFTSEQPFGALNNAETHNISSTTLGSCTAMPTTHNLCLMDCPIYYSESLVMLGLEDMKEHLSMVPPASTYLTYLIRLSLQKMIYQWIWLPLSRCKNGAANIRSHVWQ